MKFCGIRDNSDHSTYSCPPCFPRRHPLRDDDVGALSTLVTLQIEIGSIDPQVPGLSFKFSGALCSFSRTNSNGEF